MRKILFLPAFALTFMACDNKSPDVQASTADPATTDQVGATGHSTADTQKGNCDKTAGLVWSEIRQECVQIDSHGTRLQPVEQTGSATASAFIDISADKNQAELYVPETDNTIMLQHTGDGTYSSNTWRYEEATKSLFNHEKLMYQGQ
ncbi:MAG: hypothetical protein Q4F57_09565 [Weeksellaceae bacterium]|nr:hypothetical protein [Weeksellaceae bacterium]